MSNTRGTSYANDVKVDAQSKVAREREMLSAVLSSLPDAVLVLDHDWRILFANEEARRLSRIQPEDLNGKTHWELFPETVGTEVERCYRTCMEAGIPGHVEHFYSPFDVWVDVTILPIPNGLMLHYRDDSARKRAETLSDTSTRHLHQVLESITDSILCIDRNWKCTFANRAAREHLKTDALVGRDLWANAAAHREEPFASNLRRTMDHRIPTEFEAYYAEPSDTWFRIYVRPFDDGGIIIVSSDITARKRAETLRDAFADRLNQVLEATTDGIVSLDRNWNYTFLNTRAIQLLHRNDLVGRNLWQEFPAAADSDFSTFFRRTMDQRIPSEFEAFYPQPLNLWFSVQCRPSEDGIVLFFRDVTARRRSEELFREQRDLITFVQQAARIAFWNIDLTTSTITFDVGSFPVFGHPFSAIDDLERIRAILHPDDLPRIRADVQCAIQSGELIHIESRVFDQHGKIIWLETRAQTTVVDGTAIALGGMAIDITERKRNEEALALSEERYRILTELNPQLLWTGSPTGHITYANQGCLDFLDLTLADIRSEKWLRAVFAEDRPGVLERWAHAVAHGSEFEVEARLIQAATGEPRWFWMRALPGRGEQGAITNWLGVAIDIHDRKTAADALRQQQLESERQRAEIEAVYRTAPVGLALFDPVEFRYLRLNDRQAEIIGLPQEQILGRTATEIAPIPGLHEMFQQVLEGRPIRNALLQGELPMKPSEHRFWNVNYFPVYNADGTVQAISAATLEITNQKKAENALIQSEKLAAVGRLASSISHEINNPLEAVTNLLFLIAGNPALASEIRPFVELAQGELQRVCQIATQTLRFHRQAARATLVTAQEIVDAVLNLYQGRLSNSDIRVDARYHSATPILCFENDIRQVLNNLIANAIDAMRQGGSLLIRAHDAIEPAIQTAFGAASQTPFGAPSPVQRSAPRKGVRITVADTGHGMSAAVRARVFEPFYTTKDLNGTGLGLWISGGIIARHHGRISLRSSDHPDRHGTVFSIFLPHIAEAQIIESDSIPT
jgi:PAS domain S-box-containing protein